MFILADVSPLHLDVLVPFSVAAITFSSLPLADTRLLSMDNTDARKDEKWDLTSTRQHSLP
jgi:hypothetical protein|uniref:Uncharacterized protein n=1 Tax=Oryza sativa subsp. japonica TaxID=39947 RepID=Q6H4R2_ORYSJ|nr:hypothetical protein [Oryza sativa Japonica Group]BAD26287.1 hypothetical protein [Oryza sativa Japonica Group]